jgi:predicted alpha/beta-hydrolase family hydrolase
MSLTAYLNPNPMAALVLAHGAGAGQKSAWMVQAARAFSERGISTFTFDFPYMSSGRKVPDKSPVLEASWREALEEALPKAIGVPMFIGGKSMGGRIATHIAAQGVRNVSGLVLLGYPLHPPGQPQKRRDAHLADIKIPMLFVQGSKDTFGNESEMTALLPSLKKAKLHIVPGGDHSFKVSGGAAAAAAAFEDVILTVDAWIHSVISVS